MKAKLMFIVLLALLGVSCSSDDQYQDDLIDLSNDVPVTRSSEFFFNGVVSAGTNIIIIHWCGGVPSFDIKVEGSISFSKSGQTIQRSYYIDIPGPGDYTITIKDTKGKSISKSIHVDQNDRITDGLSPDFLDCSHNYFNSYENPLDYQDHSIIFDPFSEYIELQLYIPLDHNLYVTIEEVQYYSESFKLKYTCPYSGTVLSGPAGSSYRACFLKIPNKSSKNSCLGVEYVVRFHDMSSNGFNEHGMQEHLKKCTNYFEGSRIYVNWSNIHNRERKTFRFGKYFTPNDFRKKS